MELADPLLLLLGLAAVPVIVFALRRRSRGVTIPSTSSLLHTRPTLRLRLLRFLPVVRILAVLLVAVGVARPRAGEANAVIAAQGIDISLAVDISSSMTSSQFGPGKTRLEAVKAVLKQFIDGRKDDRIGLVVFQRDALALSPPTLDYQALDQMVAKLNSDLLPDGTGIGVGISTALNMLRDSNAASRVVILLTDGEHNATSIKPLDAADLAAAIGVRVYTIGVQTPHPAGIPSGVDEQTLKAIADKTGGQFYTADNPTALAAVYKEIGALETSRVGREQFESFTEFGPWFIAAGAGLLLLELLLRSSWLRRTPA